MTEQEVFVLADRTLAAVVERISDDQWAMPVPEWFLTARGADRVPTIREIVGYHAYDDAWVPDMLAGLTMEDAGKDKFDGDLLGENPKRSFATLVDAACAAAGNVGDLGATVHCSFGDYTVREYLWQVNGFRGLRAHDIARAIGAGTALPAGLVQGLWDEISPHAEEWRSMGVFPAAVPVAATAPLQEHLLGLTGRTPAPPD